MKFFDLSNMRGDVYGGITTGIIALPLALAFGEASGAGPIAGVWGAIFVGFFASLFGGTGANVSGPTGPMVVVFAGVFASLSGNPALVFAAVVLAGLLQSNARSVIRDSWQIMENPCSTFPDYREQVR